MDKLFLREEFTINMKETIINKEINIRTECKDVIKILEYKGEEGRDYSLFKICNKRSKLKVWYYMIIIDDNKYISENFPIPITEDEANCFLENPIEGALLAYNIYFDRYR